jgi:arginase family enzyme
MRAWARRAPDGRRPVGAAEDARVGATRARWPASVGAADEAGRERGARPMTSCRSGSANSAAGAPFALTIVDARISEDTPRDLRGVRVLAAHLDERFGPAPGTRLEGRRGPFERTSWRDDLPASRKLLADAGAAAAGALARGERPLTLASDCSLAIGTLPAAAGAIPELSVLWLDAHADYDTPATQTYDFLGCMSLAGACRAWDTGLGGISPTTVLHVGARAAPGDFDYAGQEQARGELRAMLPAGATTETVLAALAPGPVYVHLDPDVLDPVDFPVPYGRAGGLRAAALVELCGAVAGGRHVIGVEVTAFHRADDEPTRDRVCALLGDAVEALLGG